MGYSIIFYAILIDILNMLHPPKTDRTAIYPEEVW